MPPAALDLIIAKRACGKVTLEKKLMRWDMHGRRLVDALLTGMVMSQLFDKGMDACRRAIAAVGLV